MYVSLDNKRIKKDITPVNGNVTNITSRNSIDS